MKIRYLALLTSVLIIVFSCSATASAIDIDNCAILGFAEETYTLIANVNTNDTTCFIVTAPDVTLDCNGYSISGNNLNRHVSNIGVYSNQSNTIVKNCDKSEDKTAQSQDNTANKALFDIISEIVSEPKKSGENLVVKVSLINFGASTTIDANLAYTISDSKGNIITQYDKIVPVTTQTEFLDHINTTGLASGEYKLRIELTYAGQSFPASTEKIFYVGLMTGLFKNVSLKTFILPIIALTLLIGVYRKSLANRLKEQKENNNTNTNIDKDNNA